MEKSLLKVAQEWELKPGMMAYLNIISQKKPGYRGTRIIFWSKTQTPIKNGLYSQIK